MSGLDTTTEVKSIDMVDEVQLVEVDNEIHVTDMVDESSSEIIGDHNCQTVIQEDIWYAFTVFIHHNNFMIDPTRIKPPINLDCLYDGSYTIYEGRSAADHIKKTFPLHPNKHIKEELLDEQYKNLYRILVFIKPHGTKVVTVCTLSINTTTAREILKDSPALPLKDIVYQLMRIATEKNRTCVSTTRCYDNEVKYVQKFAEEPRDYTDDPTIGSEEMSIFKLSETFSPFKYQKCNIKFMVDRERNPLKIPYDIHDAVDMGSDLIYRSYLTTSPSAIITKDKKDHITLTGGALLDEVGLGKTMQLIAVALLNPPVNTDYIQPEHPYIVCSKATLIIAPAHLVKQWEKEIHLRFKNTENLSIISIMSKKDMKIKESNGKPSRQLTYKDLLDADFVIVSSGYIVSDNYCSAKYVDTKEEDKERAASWLNEISSKNVFDTKNWDASEISIATAKFNEVSKKYSMNIDKILDAPDPIFHLIHWHRIAIDEVHEWHISEKRNLINIMRFLKSNYQWSLSATLFDQTITPIMMVINFSSKYSAGFNGEKILNDPFMVETITHQLFRRTTKVSAGLYDNYSLPPLIECHMMLKFSPIEQSIYNAKLMNPKNEKFSEYFRKFCCHPLLSDENKYTLINCKSLDEIGNMMKQIYHEDMLSAKTDMLKAKRALFKSKIIIIVKALRILDERNGVSRQGNIKGRQKKGPMFPPMQSHGLGGHFGNIGIPHIFGGGFGDSMMFEDDMPITFDKSTGGHKKTLKDITPKSTDINRKYFTIKAVKDDKGILKQVKTLTFDDDLMNDDFSKYDDFIQFVQRCGLLRQRETVGMQESNEDNYDEAYDNYVKYNDIYEGKVLTETYYNSFATRLEKIQAKKGAQEKVFDLQEYESFDDIDFDTIDMGTEDAEEKCPICDKFIPSNNVGITKCGHAFCNDCLQMSFRRNHMCPQCRTSLKENEIWNYIYDNNLDDLNDADMTLVNTNGTKLANLIFLLRKLKGQKTVLFSQWDELLVRAGKVMTDNGFVNLFCRGTCYERNAAISSFQDEDSNIDVLMLSSTNTASGINLTCAQNIIYYDPVHGSIEIRNNLETQGTGRLYRTGQKNTVTVYRMMIRDSVEQEVHEANLTYNKTTTFARPDFMKASETKTIYL